MVRSTRKESCRRSQAEGGFALQVCFVTCNEWNYWEKCMDHDQQPVSPDNVDDFIRIGTRVRISFPVILIALTPLVCGMQKQASCLPNVASIHAIFWHVMLHPVSACCSYNEAYDQKFETAIFGLQLLRLRMLHRYSTLWPGGSWACRLSTRPTCRRDCCVATRSLQPFPI